MVYHNHISYSGAPNYGNEVFRARHGYKDAEAHDPPYRRNRDFKPVPYGSAKGMLNYRHSEPFSLLKNMKDIPKETHHHPIKYTKLFLKGAFVGGVLGSFYVAGGPVGVIESDKILAGAGYRPWSGRLFR